ncbi:ABC transporter ATP-binding protein [Candidatus Uhrbacteria bacterium]|nr:ABC transporter ATP-binding protein [Candidatus Uhrbacteria bacterium]
MLRRIPAVEEFADIGDFFDQPVKIYSSGMFVRVAFAAAINVDPDILIVDEALAVGDAKFQNKCYRKFNEFRENGKTIILVTHDVETVVRLCDCAVLLEQGLAVEIGAPNDVANIYFEILFGSGGKSKLIDTHHENIFKVASAAVNDSNRTRNELEIFLEEIPEADNCVNRKNYNQNENRIGNKRAEILDYVCVCGDDFDTTEIKTGDTIKIYMKIVFHQLFQFPVYGLTIKTIDGIKIFGTNTWLDEIDVRPVVAHEIVVFCYEIKMNLARGDFFITLAASDRVNNQYVLADHRTDLAHIHVQSHKEGFNGIVEMDAMSQIISQLPMVSKPVST